MRRAYFAATILALISSPGASAPPKKAAAPPVYYDFKGAKLGMTIDEWKAVPFPGDLQDNKIFSLKGESIPVVQPVCQGDTGSDKLLLFRSSAETAAGVVLCKYGYPRSIGTYQTWSSAFLNVAGFGAQDVDFKFLEGRLYEINITLHSNALPHVLDGLVAKFGQPTSVINDTTQNRMGATFPHTVKSWINPVASIRLESPYSKIDDLNVRYIKLDALDRIIAAERAANPAAGKM